MKAEGGRVGAGAAFQVRREALQARVNEVAKALLERGIRPTVTRVRAALGGGSPNELTPALRHWKDVVLPTLASVRAGDVSSSGSPALPLQVADLVHELWQRAMAAAVVEVRGGPTAREVAARTAEAQALRQQVTAVRDQLQRESLAFGELRAQAARHEAIAREALARVHEAELRERELLREVGGLRQRVAELEAVGGGEGVSRRGGSVGRRSREGGGVRGLKVESLARKRGGLGRSGREEHGVRGRRKGVSRPTGSGGRKHRGLGVRARKAARARDGAKLRVAKRNVAEGLRRAVGKRKRRGGEAR